MYFPAIDINNLQITIILIVIALVQHISIFSNCRLDNQVPTVFALAVVVVVAIVVLGRVHYCCHRNEHHIWNVIVYIDDIFSTFWGFGLAWLTEIHPRTTVRSFVTRYAGNCHDLRWHFQCGDGIFAELPCHAASITSLRSVHNPAGGRECNFSRVQQIFAM